MRLRGKNIFTRTDKEQIKLQIKDMLRDIFNSELFFNFVGRELNLQERWPKY